MDSGQSTVRRELKILFSLDFRELEIVEAVWQIQRLEDHADFPRIRGTPVSPNFDWF